MKTGLALLGALSVAFAAACGGFVGIIWWLASGMDDTEEPQPTQRDPRPDEYDRILRGAHP